MSHQDLTAAQERLKLHEARLQHYTTTVDAVEEFIGEARSRFRARGIPLPPISVCHGMPPCDINEAFTNISEHIQESAGGLQAVTTNTSEGVRVFLAHICIFSFLTL